MFAGVLDANVAIGLAHGGVFDLLASLYSPLAIPPAVTHEVIRQGQGRPGAAELQAALGVWITEVSPDPSTVQQFSLSLTAADREVLALAKAQGVDHILSGDAQLCAEATRHGLSCLRASEVVVLMKAQSLIPAARPVLDQMRSAGFGITDPLYQQALQAAGE